MSGVRLVGLVALIALVVAVAPAAAQTPITWSGSVYGGWAKITEEGAPGGSLGVRGNLFIMVGDPPVPDLKFMAAYNFAL